MSGTSSEKVLSTGRRKLRLVNSKTKPQNPTPSSNQTPINSHTSTLHNSHANPFSSPRIQSPTFNSTPTSSQTPVGNHTSTLHTSHGNPFSSPTIQTPAFNSGLSPQGNVESSTSEEENPQDLDRSREMNIARRGKIQIWPDGNGLFCPEYHGDVVRKMTDIYEGKFDGPYPSWCKVPQEVRDLWFNELKKYYWWEEHYEVEIRQCFEDRGKATLRDTFKEVRKRPNTRPLWLGEAIWKELWVYWNSPAFKKKSDAAKLNRASTTGIGSCVHTGGSIPINMHKKKMIDEGEEPTVSKLYLRVHQNKDNKWVDDKAEAAHEKYTQRLSEIQATQAPVPGSNPPVVRELSYDEQMKIWIEANGCTKRGRLCGFGAEANNYSSSGRSSTQNRGKAPLVHDTVATLVEENKTQKVELDSQKMVLDDVQTELKAEQAKNKKQSRKLDKCAKATQDMQAQMSEWYSVMKTLHPNLPAPIAITSLSESEDDGEDENDENDDST